MWLQEWRETCAVLEETCGFSQDPQMLLLVAFLIALASEHQGFAFVGLHLASSPASLLVLCMNLRGRLGGWMRTENLRIVEQKPAECGEVLDMERAAGWKCC